MFRFANTGCLEIPAASRRRTLSLLNRAGALAVEELGEDDPRLAARGLEVATQGHLLLAAYFDTHVSLDALRAGCSPRQFTAGVSLMPDSRPPKPRPVTAKLRRQNPPVTTRHFFLAPPWHKGAVPAGKYSLTFASRDAFGTGSHPTTRLALQAVEAFMDERGHKDELSVLDVGCGTGVLCLAAGKLGASRLVGVDISEDAVAATRRNGEAHGLAIDASTRTVDQIPGRFDLVLMNIRPGPITALAPLVIPKVGQRLVLCGINGVEEQQVLPLYLRAGLRLLRTTRLPRFPPIDGALRNTFFPGDWLCFEFEPPARRRMRQADRPSPNSAIGRSPKQRRKG